MAIEDALNHPWIKVCSPSVLSCCMVFRMPFVSRSMLSFEQPCRFSSGKQIHL